MAGPFTKTLTDMRTAESRLEEAYAIIKQLVYRFGTLNQYGECRVTMSEFDLIHATTDLDLVTWQLQDPRGFTLSVTDKPARINKAASKITEAFTDPDSGVTQVPAPETLKDALNKAFPGHKWKVE